MGVVVDVPPQLRGRGQRNFAVLLCSLDRRRRAALKPHSEVRVYRLELWLPLGLTGRLSWKPPNLKKKTLKILLEGT